MHFKVGAFPLCQRYEMIFCCCSFVGDSGVGPEVKLMKVWEPSLGQQPSDNSSSHSSAFIDSKNY